MAIVIIRRERDIHSLKLSGKDLVLALHPSAADVLKKKGMKFEIVDFTKASSQAIEWVKEWPDRKINGKSFKETSVYDGFSLWWLMENWLFYSPIWPLKPALETVAALKPVLDKTKGEIIFVDDYSPVSEAIKLAAGKRGKPVKLRRSNLKLKIYAMKAFFDISFLLRKAVFSILSMVYKPTKGKAKILFFSVYDWEILRKGRKVARQDTYIAPLLKYLPRGDVKIIGIPVGRFLGLRNIKDKLLSVLKFDLLENYNYDKNEFKNAKRDIRTGWEELKENENFRKSFSFCGINIWSIVKNQFDAYFAARWKSHLRDYLLLKTLLKEEQPSVAVYPAEMSEFGREFFYLCRTMGISSVAIQHGVFGNWLNVYHTKKELTGKYSCPLPAKTAVYGPAFRDMLVKKCNYPRGNVIVTGAQRFDRIIEYGMDIRGILGIDARKKIIAMITSPVTRSENEALTRTVFQAVKKFPNAQLIVKIHPNEGDSLYKEIKAQEKSDAIIIKGIDLYDVIRSCDAAITYLSTAGMEVILLEKPLIVVNLSGRPDVVPYVKEKAAIGVYRKEDVGNAISKALEGELKKELSTGMNAFVRKYAYKNDGLASKRICNIICEIMN